MEIIEVAIDLPVTKTYTYQVPERLIPIIKIGLRVLVPFGKRILTGYVLGSQTPVQGMQIKKILDILDEFPLFPEPMIPLFRWMANYYFYPLGEVIKTALPGGINVNDYIQYRALDTNLIERSAIETMTYLETEVFHALEKNAGTAKGLSRKIKTSIPNSLLIGMVKKRLIEKNRLIKPGITKVKKQKFVSINPLKGYTHKRIDQLTDKQMSVLAQISIKKEQSVTNLKINNSSCLDQIKSLEHHGFIQITEKDAYCDPFGEPVNPDTPPQLNTEQKAAVDKILNARKNGFSAFLLEGVTGSGKTEVYLHIVAEVVEKGQHALILVPEISLISQTERRFRARFGQNIAVLHSQLTNKERYEQWIKIIQGKAPIVIGARSSVFAPSDNLGCIIVDEEHDLSYKQDRSLHYNGRDIAVLRAKLSNCIVVLGSATPSSQSYHNVNRGKYTRVMLTKRVGHRSLPEIKIVDLRYFKNGPARDKIITPVLVEAIKARLKAHEQVLLFLNRRGFSNLLICAACSTVQKCKNCDIALTLHNYAHMLKCHYCGFSKSSKSRCFVCGGANLMQIGFGTEKLEEIMKELFPQANIARLDHDTTVRKNALISILKDVKAGNVDILIGTQMVAKGHDFPNITLVGIICADLSLNFPDYKAGEITYQLLSQVAGRSGRGDRPGEVILQTYVPDYFSKMNTGKQDIGAFFKTELKNRQELNYPPFSRMVQLKISGKDKKVTRHASAIIANICHDIQSNDENLKDNLEILGPVESILFKIANLYRWQILIKSSDHAKLNRLISQLLVQKRKIDKFDIKMKIDVDPYFLS